MSDSQQSDVPGGYFVGRPTNHPAVPEPQAAGEQKPPATTQTPNESQDNQQQEPVQQQNTNESRSSFLAKCCPCLAGGGAAD